MAAGAALLAGGVAGRVAGHDDLALPGAWGGETGGCGFLWTCWCTFRPSRVPVRAPASCKGAVIEPFPGMCPKMRLLVWFGQKVLAAANHRTGKGGGVDGDPASLVSVGQGGVFCVQRRRFRGDAGGQQAMVTPQVPPCAGCMDKAYVTADDRTAMRLFPAMDEQVPGSVAFLGKAPVAAFERADVGFFTGMGPFVDLSVGLMGKPSGAAVKPAQPGCVDGVQPAVGPQLILAGKAFATARHRTAVFFFVAVDQRVALHIAFVGKRPGAGFQRAQVVQVPGLCPPGVSCPLRAR